MPIPLQRAKATIFCGGRGSKEAEVIVHYRPQGGPAAMSGAGYASAMAAAIGIVFTTVFRNVMAVDSFYVGLALNLWDSGTTYRAKDRTGAAAGTVAGDTTPYEAAALLTKSTGAPGRPGHGRWFIPFVPEAYTDDEFLLNPIPAAYNALGAAFLSTFVDPNGVTWEPCHYSKKDATLIPIVDVQVEPHLAVQNRRRLHLLFL